MSQLMPFAGVRPPRALAGKVAALPYDVVNTTEAAEAAQGNPYSFFHVSRPEIDLPPGTDEHSDAVHQRGLANLSRFISDGALKRDSVERFYLYQQRMGTHIQLGLVACASVDEYDRGLIKKHELTRKDKEDDRTRHIHVLGGHDEPVFLTYRARNEIDAFLGTLARTVPEYDFTTDDQVGHTFWVVDTQHSARLTELFSCVETLYIADGHHRSAAASRVKKLRADQAAEKHEHGWFLAVVFAHNQMQILEYNRVVRDLNGQTPSGFLRSLEKEFHVVTTTEKKPVKRHDYGMYLDGQWYRLRAKPGTNPDTVLGSLDVSILQNQVLAPLLNIGDPRTDTRMGFVGGIRGTAELERRVDSGQGAVAFSLFPTALEQLMAVADTGQVMPPKSTWFEPKLRSGLVLHLF
jgi:uncharacterized protein (DUF1015 family)